MWNAMMMPNGVQLTLDTGNHEIIFTNLDLGCMDTLIVNVSCDHDSTTFVPGDLVDISVNVGDTEMDCIELGGIGTIDTLYNACPELSDGNATFELIAGTPCVDFTGVTQGVDTFCIVVCGEFGCDTTNYAVTVLPPVIDADTIETEVILGFTDGVCIGADSLANIDTIYNACEESSGFFVDFAIVDLSLIHISEPTRPY